MKNELNYNYYEKDKIIGYDFVKEFLGCSPATAHKVIKKSNELAKKDGIELFLKGKTTLKYFYKVLGLSTKIV